VLTPFDHARDWSRFVADLVLDPVVTRYWADFADPALGDADKERLAAEEFLPWFDEGRARDLVAWAIHAHDGEFVGISGLTIPGPPVGGPAWVSPPRRGAPSSPTRGHVLGCRESSP